MNYNEGEIIIKQGSFVSSALFIREGLLQLEIINNAGKSMIVKYASEGMFVGLSRLNTETTTYPYTVKVAKKAIVCHIKTEILQDIIAKNKKFSQYVLSWYGNDYEFLLNRISDLATKSANARIAEALLYMDEFQSDNQDDNTLFTRKDIADYAGLSIESANKILAVLKKSKMISVNGQTITILDKEKMSLMYERD